MAPKNGFRKLLSDFRGSYIKHGRAAHWSASAHAARSTHGPTNKFQESPAFVSNIRKVQELPHLCRQIVRLEYANKRPGNFHAFLYMNDAIYMSREYLAADIAQFAQQPKDGSFLSTLHSSHEFANAALTKLPSTRHAFIRQNVAGLVGTLRQWELITLMSRQDHHSSTENISSFVLCAVANLEEDLKSIGPSPSPGPLSLSVELHLRPKTSPPLTVLGKSVDEPRQSVEDFAREILDDLRHSVLVCKFTSVVTFNEAVTMHLKDSFGRSKYSQYLELESVRVISERRLPAGNQIIQWIHGPPSLSASLYDFSLGNNIQSNTINLRHRKSSEIAEVKADPMSVSTLHL